MEYTYPSPDYRHFIIGGARHDQQAHTCLAFSLLFYVRKQITSSLVGICIHKNLAATSLAQDELSGKCTVPSGRIIASKSSRSSVKEKKGAYIPYQSSISYSMEAIDPPYISIEAVEPASATEYVLRLG
ncbi:hypothetical protein CIHG_08250 [Coccidioides immitis H538.4]|uniref:Uncharacterized protein n=3 Tax=Coccidioides immitis TaxID=5501 RepID=A0A0J8R6T4_COCIT|nr:hypothetical protein CIRG_04314 [Coccidioides immitis RMSCC 2394]KMU80135.1 hypothetical protein CISG_08243 [Coccidioides immitis RMSCC 3703]KMU90440.1 hypothetical protein CIHG_08250 [Coccidioides immitis H538.4]